jgi:DNA topoisomerase-1
MTITDITDIIPSLDDQPIIADPVEAAHAAGLRYFTDARPGIRRKRVGKHFSYIAPGGERVEDTKTLGRIKALAIPPAWTDVWICPSPNGHIQATGRDAKGRKQYRYHPRWREVRDETKYTRMIAFAETLPIIRDTTDRELSLRSLTREKVLATVVQLLDATAIRVGNEEYARDNNSFGLTTLRTKHVDVDGSEIHFHFRGKSGKEHVVDVHDRRLARALQRLQDLPGQELFQYMNGGGELHSVDSGDVNDYLRQITGENFTAKDFRTWHGTVRAAEALHAGGPFASQTEAKHNVVIAIEAAAGHLGNTPSICRKSYVHPAVIDAYMDGSLISTFDQVYEQVADNPLPGLHPEEVATLAVLQQELEKERAEAS